MKKIYLLSLLILLQACSSLKNHESQSPIPEFALDASGPKDTEILPFYDKTLKPIGYKMRIGANLGEKRQDIEYAQICRPLTENINFSWNFEQLKGTKDFRTPIDLVTIFSNNKILARQTIMDNKIWLETSDKDMPKITDIYPQSQLVSYRIETTPKNIFLDINKERFTFQNDNSTKDLCLGLYRYELMRWKGMVVPEQSINIINFKEEINNE